MTNATIFTTFAGKTFHFTSKIKAIRFAIEWNKMMSNAGIINTTTLKESLIKGACRLFES
jgi:hypothetical protein